MRGAERYTFDTEVEGLLHIKMLRSPHPHAKIVAIDKSAALAVPGVHIVLTHEDAPTKLFSTARHEKEWMDPDDTRVLDEVVRFIGQKVAAVVATSEGAAEEGCRRLKVQLRHPAACHRSAAGDRGRRARDPSRQDRGREIASPNAARNIAAETHGEFGDVAAALAASAVTYQGTFQTQRVQHAALETHGGIAYVDADGVLTVRSSTLVPFLTRRTARRPSSICRPSKVRVFCKRVGGGFGGKQEMFVEDILALAALKTGRPVMLELTREEQFISTSTRHPMRVNIKAGADKNGKPHRAEKRRALQYRRLRQSWRGRCCFHAVSECISVYYCPNKKVDGVAAYTNTLPAGALRGYACRRRSSRWNRRSMKLARQLHITPFEMRRR